MSQSKYATIPQTAINAVKRCINQACALQANLEADLLPQHFGNRLMLKTVQQKCNKCCLQDKINSLALSGPYTLSANDLLCSMLWHASCLVRDRIDTGGIFHLLFDLRQMHAPDAYFGNAHCLLSVPGEKL